MAGVPSNRLRTVVFQAGLKADFCPALASSGPVCPGIALLLAHCLAARPLPPAYGLGAKPPENRQNLAFDALRQAWQDGAAMNEGEKRFSFTRAASSTSRGAKNQIPMCSLRSLTCLQVKVLPRQGMVGPSSDSRPWPGETLAGASSAVNGRACRRRRAVGGDWPAALANVQAATLRENCRPEMGSFSEANEEGNSEPPNHDRNGEGSHDRGISHQANWVSRRGRGSGMYGQYDKAKKGR